MPWKESHPVDQRMHFVTRLQRGERMSDLCREFGISRKTGHKIWSRFQAVGVTGLVDQRRRPGRIPHKTPPELERIIVLERRVHPTWGPRKLKAELERRGVRMPAASTVGEVLQRHDLIDERRRRRRTSPYPRASKLGESTAPNDIWCADYKGQFRLGDGSYCYPLTVTDHFSRKIIACEGMGAIDTTRACEVFEAAFDRFGLPLKIRTDNGAPFASCGVAGLTKLSVMWLRVGVEPERIEPGHPEQNGRHERMHRTLKQETTRPAARNLLQQQERFDQFVEEFNERRPHQALDQRPPAAVYRVSERRPELIEEPTYPLHDDVLRVSSLGRVRLFDRQVFVSSVLAGEEVGVREDADGRWLVTFFDLDLGHIDPDQERFVPLETT